MDDFYFEAMDEGSAQSGSPPAKQSKKQQSKTPEKQNSVLLMLKNEL
jgi:hypothetical protein